MVSKFDKATAVFWVYQAQFILPFRPRQSPLLRLASIIKPRLARYVREPVRCNSAFPALPISAELGANPCRLQRRCRGLLVVGAAHGSSVDES